MAQGANRKMTVLHASSLRQLVEQVNDEGIQREDIVYINKDDNTGEVLMIYYR